MPLSPPAAKNFSNDIVEIHVDSCAQLGSSSIHAVQALKELYDAIGHKKLVYIETEQGLREKTNRTNYTMWKTLGSDNTIYDTFLGLQDNALEIHATGFCKAFERRFSDYIFPHMVKPCLDDMDIIQQQIKQAAYKIIEKNDPEKLAQLGITKPDDIVLEFTEKANERSGKKIIKTAFKPLYITSKNEAEKKPIDALEKALHKIHREHWKQLTSNPRESGLSVYGKSSSDYGTFFTLIHQYQLLGAIAAQLAFALAPEHMKAAGYPRSMLAHLGEKQFDPRVIEKNAHLFPPFSLLHPPISDIADESIRQQIVMQSLRLTQFWPWSRKKELNPVYRDALQKAHHNCADHAILYYFTDILPEKPDADNRHFIVVTHDAPLIQQFAEFSSGKSLHEKKEPVLKTNQNNGEETRTKLKSVQKILRPLSESRYRFTQADGSDISLTQRHADSFPPHAVLTGREFIEFMTAELSAAKHLYPDKAHIPPQVKSAIDAVNAAIKHLTKAAMSDKQPGRIVTERVLLERLREPAEPVMQVP